MLPDFLYHNHLNCIHSESYLIGPHVHTSRCKLSHISALPYKCPPIQMPSCMNAFKTILIPAVNLLQHLNQTHSTVARDTLNLKVKKFHLQFHCLYYQTHRTYAAAPNREETLVHWNSSTAGRPWNKIPVLIDEACFTWNHHPPSPCLFSLQYTTVLYYGAMFVHSCV